MTAKTLVSPLILISLLTAPMAAPQIVKTRAAKAAAVPPTRALPRVITSQFDNARTGANLNETTLNPENVNSGNFGKLFSFSVDGDVYAQPLYLPAIEVPGKGTHNLLFIATENNTVYSFDADGRSPTPLWQRSFLDEKAGIRTLNEKDTGCPLITPDVGITSTPVIDPATGTLYVLVRTKETREGGFFKTEEYVQKLHRLDVSTGEEKPGGPMVIRASLPGRGKGSSHGKVDFNPLRDTARASLLLANGAVYLTFASACDVGTYHGWVMAYDSHTLQQTGVFAATPDDEGAGMWLGDTGPAADAEGNVFVPTGNGGFDADRGGRNFGETVLKLGLGPSGLEVRDWFTPFNFRTLSRSDLDLGSGGPLLLPDQPGDHPHLLVVGGKGGTLYLLDRDRMGKYRSSDDNHAVQTISLGELIMSAPAYWNGHLYYANSKNMLLDFRLENGRLSKQPVARGRDVFPVPGATPVVSADGARNGIVWALESRYWQSRENATVLHAYDASNIGRKLYDSEQNSPRDRAGKTLRFGIPIVVNGRVYVASRKQVDIYGLLVPPRALANGPRPAQPNKR